jgi:hypothetical protein
VGVERTSEVDSARRDGVFDGFCQSVRFRSLGRLVCAMVVRFGAFASTTMDTKNGERGTMSRPTHICFFSGVGRSPAFLCCHWCIGFVQPRLSEYDGKEVVDENHMLA